MSALTLADAIKENRLEESSAKPKRLALVQWTSSHLVTKL